MFKRLYIKLLFFRLKNKESMRKNYALQGNVVGEKFLLSEIFTIEDKLVSLGVSDLSSVYG